MDFSGIDRTERESRVRHNERMEQIKAALEVMPEARREEVEIEALRLEVDENLMPRDVSEKLLNWIEAMNDVDTLADSDLGRVSLAAAITLEDAAREDYLLCVGKEE